MVTRRAAVKGPIGRRAHAVFPLYGGVGVLPPYHRGLVMFRIEVHHYLHTDPDPRPDQILAEIRELKEIVMSTQAELAANLTEILATVTKVGDETRALIAKVADLEAAIATAGNTTPEVDAALQALRDQVAVVDALVPDATA